MKKEIGKKIKEGYSVRVNQPTSNCNPILEKRPQVEEELTALSSMITELQAIIDVLEKKLDPILSLKEPTVENDEKQIGNYLVPVASEIRVKRYSLYKILEQVESITRRIEV